MYRYLVVITLVVFGLRFLHAGDVVPAASANGDVNCDQEINIADPVLLLNWLFVGGPEPCPVADPPELLARIAELEATVAKRDTEIAVLTGALDECQAELTAAHSTAIEALSDLVACQDRLSETEADLRTVEGELATCTAGLAETEGALMTCTADLTQTEGALTNCAASLTDTENSLVACTSELQTMANERDALLDELATREKELTNTQSALDLCEAELSRVNPDLAACVKELSSAQTDLSMCEGDLAATVEDLNQANEALAAAEARIAELESGEALAEALARIEELEVPGCTDPAAANFDCRVNVDNGSCQYPGCTDPLADNFDPSANVDDDSCLYVTNGGWIAQYDAGHGWPDRASAISVDTTGGVFVTGSSVTEIGNTDYLTIKYDHEGNELWTARYDGPATEGDNPTALATDSLGNVYVSGTSVSIGPKVTANEDFATVKYDSEGNQVYVARYDGGDGDNPTALVVSPAGNAYVAGFSAGTFTTVKYDASGEQLWIARFSRGRSVPRALSLDAEEYVYVTGDADGAFATIKYAPDGTELWSVLYDRLGYDSANALVVDHSQDVIVTGSSRSRYTTIKYDPQGEEIWTAEHFVALGSSSQPFAITVDSEDNVIVTGTSSLDGARGFLTVKYDPQGAQIWEARYLSSSSGEGIARAVTVDFFDNVYVAGQESGDFTVVKYDVNGNQLWDSRVSPGAAAQLAVDGSGNVIATGQVGISSSSDYFTVKYRAGAVSR